MIKSITVTNYVGEETKFELANPGSSGFIVRKADGLGPAKATINVSDLSTADGSIFNSSRIETRNILIHLKFMWGDDVEDSGIDTIEDVRQLSYKIFPLKKWVDLVIETDNRTSRTRGWVESNDPDIFSSDEGSGVSIICPDPILYKTGDMNEMLLRGVEPLFEFPFSNEDPEEKTIIMGEILDYAEKEFNYEGDAEIGAIFTIHALGGTASNCMFPHNNDAPSFGIITIWNVDTRESMHIDTAKVGAIVGIGFIEGDTILINTTTGQKTLVLLRNGEEFNILNAIDLGSDDWFKLRPGRNHFAFTADDNIDNLIFLIEHDTGYVGV